MPNPSLPEPGDLPKPARSTAAEPARISVICTVRNEARHLRAALLSALTPDVLELVVVDDGSTDGTDRVLQHLAAHDPRVRVIAAADAGRGPAIDQALRATTGQLVMNIDADDVLHPEWSRIGAALMDENPAMAAIAAAPRYLHQDDEVAWRVRSGSVRAYDVSTRLAFYNPVAHSSAIMRRSALEGVGGYDRRRRTHIDYDLWIRLAAAGWRLGVANARMVAKRVHRGQKFERHGRLAYLRASGLMQARAIAAVHAGPGAWITLAGRMAWGLLPRAVRMGVRRLLAWTPGIQRPDAAGSHLESTHPPVRHI